jgi:hypothetical protein
MLIVLPDNAAAAYGMEGFKPRVKGSELKAFDRSRHFGIK